MWLEFVTKKDSKFVFTQSQSNIRTNSVSKCTIHTHTPYRHNYTILRKSIMQSICWTTRLLSRALRSGFSTLIEPTREQKPRFVSVACGFPKDFLRSKYKLGKFGDDSWFSTQIKNADAIGMISFYFKYICVVFSYD